MGGRKNIKLRDKKSGGFIIKSLTLEETFYQFKNFLHSRADKFGFDSQVLYENANISHDDAFQVASVGLIKAYNTYNPEAGIMFITYLSTVVDNEILMFMRKQKNICVL